MGIALFRVDERLIHGQVTLGWGALLHPNRYVVVDPELAGSEWEQELYRLGAPPGTEVLFLSTREAALRLPQWDESPEVTVLLARHLPTMSELANQAGLRGREINLGGIHPAEGRESLLPYLALGPPEREAIRALLASGIRVMARDLPASVGLEGEALLRASSGR
jgi:mannose/fructose/N-acetylgalactosamine-specific phosphotransferase system component IIB